MNVLGDFDSQIIQGVHSSTLKNPQEEHITI